MKADIFEKGCRHPVFRTVGHASARQDAGTFFDTRMLCSCSPLFVAVSVSLGMGVIGAAGIFVIVRRQKRVKRDRTAAKDEDIEEGKGLWLASPEKSDIGADGDPAETENFKIQGSRAAQYGVGDEKILSSENEGVHVGNGQCGVDSAQNDVATGEEDKGPWR